MTDTKNTKTHTDKAAQALDAFANGPAKHAADVSAAAFEQAAERIAKALEGAAVSGELSFKDLAAAMSRDLAGLAINEFLLNPLQGLLGGLGGGAAASPNPVSVVMNIAGVSDAKSFQKSQGQIAASLSRAVSQGNKYI